jgi:hypothetical protein
MAQQQYVLNRAGNGLANYNGWTVPNYNNTGTAYKLNANAGMMQQVTPEGFVGPPQMLGLEGFKGMTGDLGGNQFTLDTPGTDWGNVAGYVGAGAGVLQGLSGLTNAYMGYKNYKLAKEQFGFQKGLVNRNLANQAKVINNTYDNAAQVAAGMIGGGSYNPATDSQGNYGMTDQAVVDRYAEKAKEKHVDGSPIK